jgi:hypothetical protein
MINCFFEKRVFLQKNCEMWKNGDLVFGDINFFQAIRVLSQYDKKQMSLHLPAHEI